MERTRDGEKVSGGIGREEEGVKGYGKKGRRGRSGGVGRRKGGEGEER